MTDFNDPYCVVCGCSEYDACDDGFGDGCSWVRLDEETGLGLCSTCHEGDATLAQRFDAGERMFAPDELE